MNYSSPNGPAQSPPLIPVSPVSASLSPAFAQGSTATTPGFFFGCTHSMWKFPGQGSNLHHNSNLRHCHDDAGSFPQGATWELRPRFLHRQKLKPRNTASLLSVPPASLQSTALFPESNTDWASHCLLETLGETSLHQLLRQGMGVKKSLRLGEGGAAEDKLKLSMC